MTTTLREIRRGLPRVAGGEPWPPAGVVAVEDRPSWLAETAATVPAAARAAAAPAVAAVAVEAVPATSEPAAPVAPAQPTPALAAPLETEQRRVPLRRGLPRARGAEPWPPAGSGVLTVGVGEFRLDAPADASPAAVPVVEPAATPVAAALVAATAEAAPITTMRVALRRGLPRSAGGDPWPPAGEGVRSVRVVAEPVPVAEPTPIATAEPVRTEAPATPPSTTVPPAAAAAAPRPVSARAAASSPAPATARSSVLATVVGAVRRAAGFPALLFVTGVVVLGVLVMLAMWLRGTGAGAAFVARFPGTYALPATAEPGFPTWVRWNHFLNLFFLIMIVRTGLANHYEKKPPAYWTPRWSGAGGKVSLTLWLHLTLDLLWLVNGLVFVVLLFVSSHWIRLVPTSWEVFPNAISTGLQYLSLDWPAEDGWVAYNSLQQLSYFVIVFVAAPLAAVTGFRMSGFWPARATRLLKAYPLEVARAVHFPTMIFFVVFVIMHVTMVFATGARRNLNHMFVGNDTTSWAGFWVFVLGLAAVAAVWELARPLLLAPVASLSGTVSQR